jgi:16S rRNA processing protein RimM
MTPRRMSLEHSNADAAGSPPTGEPVFLAVGKLRRPHGVHGEIIMDVLTDFPERLKPGKKMLAGDQHQPVQIRSVRGHDQALLIAFTGIDTPEQAGEFRNQILYATVADQPPLEDGEYYHHELIGLSVYDEQGNLLGELAEIMETGANDVYVVRPEAGQEILLPAIDEVILEINLEKKTMSVHLLPGLIASPD